MNTVCLVGRLGQDPEVKYFDSGSVRAKFSLAIDNYKQDQPDWFEVEAWGKTAQVANEYCRKGSQVGIAGRLKQERWEKDGQKRSKIIVVCERLDLLGGKPGSSQAQLSPPCEKVRQYSQPESSFVPDSAQPVDYDNIPF